MSHRRIKLALHVLFSGALGLALVLAPALMGAVAHAAPLEAVAFSQPEPGDVTVTVRAPGAVPPANAFTLQLPGANGAPTTVSAQSIEAANELSPDLATAVLLCVDRSGSMRSAVTAIKAALKEVLAGPRPDLRIALMSFGSDTPVPTQFFSDSGPIIDAVDAISAETGHDGKTRLYDALNIGISTLVNLPMQGPKRLIVITDGKDEGSQTPSEVVAEMLHGRQQPMDAIAFGQVTQKGAAGLATLAKRSSGAFVLARNPSALIDALRNDLGTAPAPAYDVRFHYDAAAGAPPLQSAQLAYAADPGAAPVLMPIRIALAAPASQAASQSGPQPAPQSGPSAAEPPAISAQTAQAAPASEPKAASKVESASPGSSAHGSFITIGSVKIDVKIGVSVLTGLAALLFWIAYTLRRKPPPVPPPVDTRTSEPSVARQATRIGEMFPPPSPGHPAALLVNESTRQATISYAIEKPNVRIGGDEANDLVVRDDFVSRKHANIRFESGTLYLTDLGSSNGTFLNDAPVSRVMTLKPGDKIRIGHTTWQVLRANDARSEPRTSGERFERPVP